MTKVTFFTIPRGFDDPDVRQRQLNSILNWRNIGAHRIVLFGNEPGTAAVAMEHNCLHVPDVLTNEDGLPYLSDAFTAAWDLADTELVCYANCDILFPQHFLDVVSRIDAARYMLTGRRWNTNAVTEPIDYTDAQWWPKLEAAARANGDLHPEGGMDYFLHHRHILPSLPPLLVGRWFSDNVLIGLCLKAGIPVIDATEVVFAIHQTHDYEHAGGSMAAVGDLPESAENAKYLPNGIVWSLAHATHRLMKG